MPSVVLRAEEGEDDNVDGNNADEDTLDEGVVWHGLCASRGFDRRMVLVTTDCGREEVSIYVYIKMGRNGRRCTDRLRSGQKRQRPCYPVGKLHPGRWT